MAVFSTNQNRQLYVAKAVKTGTATVANEGDRKLITQGDQMYFQYFGADGQLRSDIIDKSSISYVKVTPATSLQRKLKVATIAVDASALEDEKPIKGQEYIAKVYIYNYLAPGDDNVQVKYGSVYVNKEMTLENFYTALADSLTKNFSKEVAPLLTFTATASGVTVTEVKQKYVVGTKSQESVNFDIMPSTIVKDGEEITWAVVNEKTGKVAIAATGAVVNNGSKIADLEYFCMGERGDQYRKVAGVNAIPVKPMVDPESAYNVLDIHYSFSDSGVNVQKSEKDITIVSTADLSSLKTAIDNFIKGTTTA